jgi:hypothetical protein
MVQAYARAEGKKVAIDAHSMLVEHDTKATRPLQDDFVPPSQHDNGEPLSTRNLSE